MKPSIGDYLILRPPDQSKLSTCHQWFKQIDEKRFYGVFLITNEYKIPVQLRRVGVQKGEIWDCGRQLRPIHTERKRKEKQKFAFMFVIFFFHPLRFCLRFRLV